MKTSSEKLTIPETVLGLKTQKESEGNIVEHMYAEALDGESYEDTAAALERVDALRDFRQKVSGFPFGSFHELTETITNINKLPVSREKRDEQTAIAVETLRERAQRMSPRVADLYQVILAEIAGESYNPRFKEALETMDDLENVEDQRSDLDVLFSMDVSWEMKLNRIKNRLVGVLNGFRSLDKREGNEMDDDIRKWREEELKKAPTRPPDETNRSRPEVDPMDRLKEGERAPAIWTINPGFDGVKYFKEKTFSKWDDNTREWVEDYTYASDITTVPLSGSNDPRKGLLNVTMRASVEAGRLKRLPISYTHGLHSIDAGGRNCSVKQDQNGDFVFAAEGGADEIVDITIVLAPNLNKKFISKEPAKIRAPYMPAEFSKETNQRLEEIASKKRGNIAQAKAIKSYVVRRIQYLAPKDRAEAEYYNNIYRTSSKGFAGAVDEVRKGDCDVGNTYFAALCARLNIPVRHCVGHSVKGRDEEGVSSIHSGTGHGWSEVFDEIKKEWVMMDATSAGDPNLEDNEQQTKKHKDYIPGDDQEATCLSDEHLEELRKKLAEHKEELSYTKEERHLAEGAGIELKEARQIVKEINEAERTRLPNGELIIDTLANLFNAIVESRRVPRLGYTGPVRESEGGEEIEDIVGHYIQAKAGEMDPRSRNLSIEKIEEEKLLGGFDFYMVGDKSGSMQSAVGGERLWQMQRRAEYLIFSSLYQFERNLMRAGLQKENALSVRTQGISFRGNGPEDIDLDKPLSSVFTPQDKVKMWYSLTEQGGGNGDVAALSYIYEQIQNEIKETEKRGAKDNRLRLIIACSDGGYVGAEGQMRALGEELGKLNAIVVAMGLTETAASVPIVMHNPPHSRGDIVRDMNDLPALVAKHIVLEAIKLFPEKARANAKQVIERSIAKFKNIK